MRYYDTLLAAKSKAGCVHRKSFRHEVAAVLGDDGWLVSHEVVPERGDVIERAECVVPSLDLAAMTRWIREVCNA